MADEQEGADRKRELIARLERARSNMSRNLTHVRYRSAVGDRAKESVRKHAGGWLTGAVITGLFTGWRLMQPSPRVKKVYIDANTGKPAEEAKEAKRGFWMGIISVVMNLAQPAVVAVIQKRLLSLASQENQQVAQDAARTAAQQAKSG